MAFWCMCIYSCLTHKIVYKYLCLIPVMWCIPATYHCSNDCTAIAGHTGLKNSHFEFRYGLQTSRVPHPHPVRTYQDTVYVPCNYDLYVLYLQCVLSTELLMQKLFLIIARPIRAQKQQFRAAVLPPGIWSTVLVPGTKVPGYWVSTVQLWDRVEIAQVHVHILYIPAHHNLSWQTKKHEGRRWICTAWCICYLGQVSTWRTSWLLLEHSESPISLCMSTGSRI